jgi:DNA-binding response OmpR family regulator
MKRKILLVDDEVAILLTLKAVLEISGFEVDTAASAKEAKLCLKKHGYAMVITDMRMESDEAGRQVIRAARSLEPQPAIALLTAFPVAEEDWQAIGADNMLVKPMQIQVLLRQIEELLAKQEAKRAATSGEVAEIAAKASVTRASDKPGSRKAPAKRGTPRKAILKKAPAKKVVLKKTRG